jgi:hypothetical protein
MGNSSLQIIAENVSVIASPKTWIEGGAIQQLQITAKLPGMHRVVGMPDLHPGRSSLFDWPLLSRIDWWRHRLRYALAKNRSLDC